MTPTYEATLAPDGSPRLAMRFNNGWTCSIVMGQITADVIAFKTAEGASEDVPPSFKSFGTECTPEEVAQAMYETSCFPAAGPVQ